MENQFNCEEPGVVDQIIEARGLSLFLSRLPQTVVDNFVSASNIPRLDRCKTDRLKLNHLKLAEQRLRQYSSVPNLRDIYTGDDIMIMDPSRDRPASVPLVNYRSVSSESSPRSSISPNNHLFYMPLLHILPETEVYNACIRINPCRKTVRAVNVDHDCVSTTIACTVDDDGNEKEEVIVSQPVYCEISDSSDIYNQHIVSFESLPSLEPTSDNRSAFELLLDTVRKGGASEDLVPEEVYDTIEEMTGHVPKRIEK